MSTKPVTLQISVGAELISFSVDQTQLTLEEIGRVAVMAPIQYVWPHPSRNILYVVSSNRSVSKADDVHSLATIEVDEHFGSMRVIAQIDLPTRPIHLTVDPSGCRLFVAYNAPSRVTVHSIFPDGTVADATTQMTAMTFGHYPHQIRITPSGKVAILVARGNDAHGDNPEQPGSLILFSLLGNSLTRIQTVAPGRGYGFGPRHLDIHPGGRWVAVSIERQNELHIYELTDDQLSNEPVFKLSTLPGPVRSPRDQLAGTVHFHQNGKYLYVVNRNDASVYGDHREPSAYEGNNIVAYSFDQTSGKPVPIQYVLTESVHVRTFSLDDESSLLVAASILPAFASREKIIEKVPAKLSFFRIGTDGKLSLAKVEEMGNQHESMFWSCLNTNKKAATK
jgi:6-phosphogluconolactonase